VISQRLHEWARHPNFASLAIGVAVGSGVCAPFFGVRRVFLLDWSIGPHEVLLSPSVLGLNGGLTSGVGASIAITLLNDVLGNVATWIPLLFFFPIAMVGAGRLIGGSYWTRISTGLLYAVNPFVFSRIFVGHFPLLLGYALLPFAIRATMKSITSTSYRWVVPALWWAGLTAVSPHFAWIFGLVILAVAVVTLFAKRKSLWRVTAWFAVSVALFTLMSAYILLPHSATNLPTQVGKASLELYRTAGDAHLGLFFNVIALYGFWRLGPGPILPKDIISGWPFLMLAVLIVAGLGLLLARRKRTSEAVKPLNQLRSAELSGEGVAKGISHSSYSRRDLALLLFVVGACGYFLALGSQGPTGWLFLLAYDHIPFFAIMREPQKFLMLFALALAVFFGWGVEYLAKINLTQSKIRNYFLIAVVGIALPLGYSANIFGGLNGQIAPSTVPTSYHKADVLMGTGEGNILYLPWHQYLSYPFTNDRVVSNIGPSEFRRSVISGDNVQATGVETQSTSPRSAFLEKLYEQGSNLQDFGTLVAPLGVKYVVLAKTIDWTTYSWLAHQRDLREVLNSPSLEIWQNLAYAGVGWRAPRLKVVKGLESLISLSLSNGIVGDAISSVATRSSSSNTPANSLNPRFDGTSSFREVTEISPVAYWISPGVSGWATIDAPFQRGWYLNGREAIQSAEGTLLVRVGPNGGVLTFNPWGLVRLGYILSISIFFVLLVLAIFGPKLRRNKSTTRNSDSEENYI
jgi:hypothetical protein